MRKSLLLLAAFVSAPLAAQMPPPKPGDAPSPAEIVAAAPKADWTAIDPNDLLVMDLAPDAKGKARRVVIQLLPPPFSQGWVGNVRKLAAAHWWDGLAVVRVQDNYVTQWGDPDGDDPKRARKLPDELAAVPQAQYVVERILPASGLETVVKRSVAERAALVAAAADQPAGTQGEVAVVPSDAYAPVTAFWTGWPIGSDETGQMAWPVHCYGMVGVGRDMPPNTGTGAELYTVIGHAPRQLDRNIALVGRIIDGMEFMSSLPRGHGPLGFYDLAQGDERVPIVSVRLATDLASDKPLPAYEYLSTESASFAKYADARVNRRDPFYIRPAGGADVCNIPVPVRRVK
ncbi:MAG: peptidylprolyl isomerase [Proteobacteria bacterium]|nr:peptidylprolyl isomerase [Pseudomonadota bacterium]